jgi:hypothetical protein
MAADVPSRSDGRRCVWATREADINASGWVNAFALTCATPSIVVDDAGAP